MKQRLSFRFGRFELRPAEHLLLDGGTTVRLTPQAFDTLAALVSRHGAVVTRDELIREVWPDTFVEEGGLTQNVSVLRKLLNHPGERELIETVAVHRAGLDDVHRDVGGPAGQITPERFPHDGIRDDEVCRERRVVPRDRK